MIACKTIIGFGFPTKAGTQKAHSDAPGEDEIAGARKILGWDSPPFVIPESLLREWREIGAKGRKARLAWADRVKAAPAKLRSEFERGNDGELPADWQKAIAAARAEFIASGKTRAIGPTAIHIPEIHPNMFLELVALPVPPRSADRVLGVPFRP
jgi:transketolase